MSPESKDWWEKTEVIAKTLGATAIPVLLLVFGLRINATLQEQALMPQWVSLAVSIVQNPDTTEAYRPIREYGIDVLREYSPVDLPEVFLEKLRERQVVLVGGPDGRPVAVSAPPPPTNLRVTEITDTWAVLRVDPYQHQDRRISLFWFYREGGDTTWAFAGAQPPDEVERRMLPGYSGRTQFGVAAYDMEAQLLSEIISSDTVVVEGR